MTTDPRPGDPTDRLPKPISRRARAGGIAALALTVTAGCASLPSVTSATPPAATTTAAPAPAGTTSAGTVPAGSPTAAKALAAAGTLRIRPAAAMAGYRRDQFGPAWADVDHNGCDTRDDILNRDLTAKQWRTGTHQCVVIAGILHDPYTGRTIHFTKAHATAVQIDHVVPLGDAWQTGAASWSDARRKQFANDPENLLAVDGPANEAKGDDDTSEWLPPNTASRCSYVARQVTVKARYGLWVTATEQRAIHAVLAQCPTAN
jgi:Protein of unknown function (DUF1524)